MTALQLRATLDAHGYTDAEIVGSTVILRDRTSGWSLSDHRQAFKAAGIPVGAGGVSIHDEYLWLTVKLDDGARLQAEAQEGGDA